jgi:hypothetical protein
MGASHRRRPRIRYFVLDTFFALPQNPDHDRPRDARGSEGGDTMAKKKAAKKKKKK